MLDIFGADPTFGPVSKVAVRHCLGQGGLIACDIVWAEVAASFPSAIAARDAMHRLQVGFSPMEEEPVLRAGGAFKEYRRRGGARSRMVADFMIGAHALHQAERLLTRDRGFYRTYFSRLPIVDPTR